MQPNKTKSLLEPSIADALAWLPTAPGLREGQRRQWTCSVRFIVRALGRPPELLAARLTALAQPTARLHHTQMGVTTKTLANHKSNVRAALKRFGREENVPLRGTPFESRMGTSQGRNRRLPHPRQYLLADAVLFGS